MFERKLKDGTIIKLDIYNKDAHSPSDVIKCGECEQEFRRRDNITIKYERSSEHNHCCIDCVFQHVVLEILGDDRKCSEMYEMIVKAHKIHEENL